MPCSVDGEKVIPVAIKVLHPDVEQEIATDLRILKTLGWVAETVFPSLQYLNIGDCLQQFSHCMMQQVKLSGGFCIFLFVTVKNRDKCLKSRVSYSSLLVSVWGIRHC